MFSENDQELLYNAVSTITVRLTDALGAPVTGVPKAQVDPWFCKAGATPAATNLPAADFDWDEPSAANMPGIYRFTINATGVGNSRLDTLGAFTLRLTDVGAGGFVDYYTELTVTGKYSWDFLERIHGLGQGNYNLTVLTTNAYGFMLTGTITLCRDNAMTDTIDTYDVVVTYDAVTQELDEFEVTET